MTNRKAYLSDMHTLTTTPATLAQMQMHAEATNSSRAAVAYAAVVAFMKNPITEPTCNVSAHAVAQHRRELTRGVSISIRIPDKEVRAALQAHAEEQCQSVASIIRRAIYEYTKDSGTGDPVAALDGWRDYEYKRRPNKKWNADGGLDN
jgi:predicted transcriptional regulator